MKLINDPHLNFSDVMLLSQRSTLESRSQVQLEREFQFYHSPRVWSGIPLMCANMAGIGTFTMARALERHKIITALHKYYSGDQLNQFFLTEKENMYDYAWVTIGMKDSDIARIKEIWDCRHVNIVIDVPNGHIEKFVDFCAKVRHEFFDSIICAGNVTNPASVQELIIHGGVDIVKLFVGPGSACETTKVTGVGAGTFTTAVDCSGTAHGLKNGNKRLGLVCGDGGFSEYGDISKGYGAGLDFIMLGGMFAGTDECDESEWEFELEYENMMGCPSWYSIKDDPETNMRIQSYSGIKTWHPEKNIILSEMRATGNKRKTRMKYYGMSSHHAQEKHGDGKKDYRASEGKILTVPYKGPVDDALQEMKGGIRSACLYIGSDSIKDMNKCAVFAKR